MYLIVSFNRFQYRRNTRQVQQKIDQIYLMLHDWLSCLVNEPKQQITAENFAPLGLSMQEVEDFVYGLRCLIDKGNYNEQVLLMQTGFSRMGMEEN